MIKPLFHLGNVTATAQVVNSLDEQTILAIVRRHAMGDWGDLCSEDRMSNMMAIEKRELIKECFYAIILL